MANKWKKRLKEIEAEKKKTGASLKGVWEEQQKRTKITQEYRAKNKAKKKAEAAAKRIKADRAKVQNTQDRVKKILAQADLDKMSFKKAFNEKRVNQKAKTFTWRGKRYTTELAKPAPSKKEKAVKPKLHTLPKTEAYKKARAAENKRLNEALEKRRKTVSNTAARKRREFRRMMQKGKR